ncbi:protein lava lamp-like isoform X2 [Vanessa cardui]|uniref:protein lava lamp-like isoform X2 n=1 Tax=Vanessa cardui TaxID=171605 RepID=UPI001F12EC2D|nr:protein lava lamp-like isoform X2 [Vanessa cardui]
MSESTNINKNPGQDKKIDVSDSDLAAPSEVSSIAGSVTHNKHSISSERQIKFERAQKCLENAALVSKRIKEHRKATAELLGRPFEDVGDTASEAATTISEKTSYSVATDTSTAMSVQDALNIPGISESLANTLKQKEILMERIKQYKEISKRPMKKVVPTTRRDSITDTLDVKKDSNTTDITKLTNLIKEKDNSLSIMQVKVKAMETTILDLQEKITEKDQIIEAKNKATTLMSDSLSKKEKDTTDLLEDTKQQMIKMQNNFIAMETEWKEEKLKLINEIEEKNDKIKNLEEANTILENSRFDISVAHSKLAEELDSKVKEINELQDKIKQLEDFPTTEVKDQKDPEEEKGSLEISNMEELTKKIELLEQINCELRHANKEFESQLALINQETKTNISPSKKGSPLPVRKGGRNAASKMKSPWSHLSAEPAQQEQDKKGKSDKPKLDMILQSLNKDILQKEYLISEKDTLISELQSENTKKEEVIRELQSLVDKQKEKEMIDIGIFVDLQQAIKKDGDGDTETTSTDVKDLENKLTEAQNQIATLNDEIDVANKNMIKVKSNFKLKLKQMQKTIENFSKVSDANGEIVKLNEEIHQLTQKVAELEEEKGNLQLHLVDYDSGRLTESDVYKKLVEIENLAEARLKSISLLETQKFDLVQELHSLQQKNLEMEDKLADISFIQNEQVCSEMKSVQLEEQIDQLQASKKELDLIIDNLKLDKEQLNGTIKNLQEEKEELIQKLENYIQENIELSDKLEKLSAEKVSSAESIEIVESLTTQEKLELEEYNKSLQTEKKIEDDHPEKYISQSHEQKEKLMEESMELKKKIELFTSERQEVMEKMNNLSLENESLNKDIKELKDQCDSLRNSVHILEDEKNKLISLNDELNQQIEDLKHEKSEILRETAEAVKPLSAEDVIDGSVGETVHQDDKIIGDKGASRVKSVKQLTKEILKLKNTIKEREDEIGDCQMKILSLEEQQEKHKEILQNIASKEKTIKKLTDENNQLKKEVENLSNENKAEHNLHLTQTHELLQSEIQKVHQEYNAAINARDSRIHELENILLEYEKQVINYSNTLQQKDKEMSEYINQITKLNDLSQKLKSTVDLLEDEKAKDQNSEHIKSLNKQISLYQKTLSDYEEKLRTLEEEKVQLLSLKSKLENKSSNLEQEIQKLQELLKEKQNLIKDTQMQQQKQADELSTVLLQAKERDEEIHEIKLQLRKESIENEKLHNIVVQKSNEINELTKLYDNAKDKLNSVSVDKNEQLSAIEAKNKELMEKLKKFAVNIKKKSAMYTELENQYHETQKQLQNKTEHYEQLLIQVETIPALQEKLKHAEEEFNRLQSQKILLEQKSQEILNLQSQIEVLHKNHANDVETITKLNESLDLINKDLYFARDENNKLKAQIESLNNKIVEFEIDQKNNANLLTKLSCLEGDLNQKLEQITVLSSQVESLNEKLTQVQFGHDAKVQERDMYIESLQSEIDKYKNRIYRLEESISAMENGRQSLERKADNLDIQLHEKQKAYSEYINQEDELVSRLAVLIDNDRVVEKQLKEIESENKELHYKMQNLNDEYQNLQKFYADLQNKYSTLEMKAAQVDTIETDISSYQSHIRELESNIKKITNDHNTLLGQKKRDIEELESEFNTQIENAIKEKKLLSEKYEKINDHVCKLESKLNEYKTTIERQNIKLNEMAHDNQMLVERSTHREKEVSPDYTEQYISEINKMNSILNCKNEEITELSNKIQHLQAQYLSQISDLQNKNTELTKKIEDSNSQINNLIKDINLFKENNDHLNNLLTQKDEQIKQIMDNKKLFFEMNIPKTEGMTISSTIEAMDNESKPVDILSLQSQIISDAELLQPVVKKVSENIQTNPRKTRSTSEGVTEEVIVPKKSYLCYKEDEVKEENDPFNSEEGWGLESTEESEVVTPGSSQLYQQIQLLNETNTKLKQEVDTSNTKLLKALKKLKELKIANDMLSKDLQLTKKISQSSMLDMTIENELSNNVEELEKKVQELNTDLNKEKLEKEALKKQNEVFKNANDRLLEMKEKMDNELEMWKFQFKQVNDKFSSLQWEGDGKDSSPNPQSVSTQRTFKETKVNEELLKLEKENDELQSIIDNVNAQNKELSTQQEQLKAEINILTQKLHQQSTLTCDNCNNLNEYNKELTKKQELLESELNYHKQQLEERKLCADCEKLKLQIEELNDKCKKLEESNATLNENLQKIETQYSELLTQNVHLKEIVEENQFTFKMCENELLDKNRSLMEEVQSLKLLENEATSKITSLNAELDNMKLQMTQSPEKLNVQNKHEVNALELAEKYSTLEEHCLNLKQNLDEAAKKNCDLELENKSLTEKAIDCEKRLSDLNAKLQNLNSENDQLLSTVTELRSSVSSAMDQRGFEIAELWKQHLGQREAEFQQIECDLRTQLTAAEAKYEQLLENVQSSSQEETNKIVLSEQISSLQTKLQEKEEQLRSLQLKYAEVINELDMLRSEMEDEKLIHENKILVQQEEYEKMLQELNNKNQLRCDDYESTLKNLRTELDATASVNLNLNQQIEEIRNVYENKLVDLSKQLQVKESEIYQKTRDFTITLTQRNEEFENVRKQLIEYEKKVEDLTYEKESELAILRLKMHENTERFDKMHKDIEDEKNSISESLKEKIIECTNLNKQIGDLNKVLEEYANRAAETQTVLESQELEIVTLKDEISSLEDTLRAASTKIEKHVTFSSDTKQGQEGGISAASLDKDLLDAVPRAELDLALYMLHQRDVRCEELTMELTQLLEERDTLQLRLSDSLRSYEELKSRCNSAGLDVSTSSSHEGVSDLPTFNVEKERQFVDTHKGQTSRSSSISDPDGDRPKLQAKLSELRSVKHSRDVRFRHESEQRQLGMRLLQRDVANLPAEAVEQLTQAHHTLSRDTQSTPTVLLNWLRGKSTPKVVHM